MRRGINLKNLPPRASHASFAVWAAGSRPAVSPSIFSSMIEREKKKLILFILLVKPKIFYDFHFRRWSDPGRRTYGEVNLSEMGTLSTSTKGSADYKDPLE